MPGSKPSASDLALNLQSIDLESVAVCAALTEDGRLEPVGGLRDKLEATVGQSLGLLHTVVVAKDQPVNPRLDTPEAQPRGRGADTLLSAIEIIATDGPCVALSRGPVAERLKFCLSQSSVGRKPSNDSEERIRAIPGTGQ